MQKYSRLCIKTSPGFEKWALFLSSFARNSVVPCLTNTGGGDLTEWISDGDEIIVDFVGRYENLNEDWSKICQTLQVPALPLGRENQVVRQDYRVFYDNESRELVANRFARTIELFEYRFSG